MENKETEKIKNIIDSLNFLENQMIDLMKKSKSYDKKTDGNLTMVTVNVYQLKMWFLAGFKIGINYEFEE